nr:hypothetical protein [Streptomyces buecherae]
MGFDALDELLDESLPLPIGGRVFVVPAPSAEVGLRTQAIINAAALAADGGRVDEQVLSDAAERDLYRDVLGPAHGEMVEAGVTWPALKHAAITAMVWIAQDKAAAEQYWNSAPNRAAPNRAARRASSRSAAASETPSRGSSSGTRTRPAREKSRARTPR